MKKKILWLAGLLAALSAEAFAYNIYAPNSFDTVSPKSWDYRTVEELLKKGKAPDYTADFLKNGAVTRYELACVLKNMLDNEKPKDPDQEVLRKLRQEYERELDALGYKKPRAKPVPGKTLFEFTGDGRIRAGKDGNADGRVRTEGRWLIGGNDASAENQEESSEPDTKNGK